MNRFCQLGLMISFTFAFFLVELVVGYVTNSLTLVSDSYHMLSDVVALCVAVVALKMSTKRSAKNTYGWARADILGALVNSVFLVALCFTIVVEAVVRLTDPEPKIIKHPVYMLVVGIAGLCLNLLGLALFHQHGHVHGGFVGHGGHERRSGHGHGNSHRVRRVSIDDDGVTDACNSGQRRRLRGKVGNRGEDRFPNFEVKVSSPQKIRKEVTGFARSPKTAPMTAVTRRDKQPGHRASGPVSGRRISDDMESRTVDGTGSLSDISQTASIQDVKDDEQIKKYVGRGKKTDPASAGTLTRSHDTASSLSTTADGSINNGLEYGRVERIDKHRKPGPSRKRRISDDLESGAGGSTGFESDCSEMAAVSMTDLYKNGVRVSPPKTRRYLTVKSVFLHCLGDALGSLLVIASALVGMFVDAPWKCVIDPVLSALLHDFATVKESALILLQTVPSHIRIGKLKKKLLRKVSGILDLHEFHVWQLTSERIIATVHVRCKNTEVYGRLADDMKTFFHEEGIHSLTIQPEFTTEDLDRGQRRMSDVSEVCSLKCGPEQGCSSLTCCRPVDN